VWSAQRIPTVDNLCFLDRKATVLTKLKYQIKWTWLEQDVLHTSPRTVYRSCDTLQTGVEALVEGTYKYLRMYTFCVTELQRISDEADNAY
jgi:hypothetical protein